MHVIVLNADYTFINSVSWKRAFNLVSKGKVEIVKYTDEYSSSESIKFRIPAVIKLVNFVKQVYKNLVPFNKKNILIRDNYTCSYCGERHKKVNVDHVIPISKKGQNTWENCVCCCFDCNRKKADKTPQEANMKLRIVPKMPSVHQFLQAKFNTFDLDL